MNDLFSGLYLKKQINRGLVRSLVRKQYFNNILKRIDGPTIDLGCGAGNLLESLPHSSIGLEINLKAIEFCKKKGLNVVHYNPEIDQYQFKSFIKGQFKYFTMLHVLEHVETPELVVRKILLSCQRLGIKKVFFVVPGLKGFRSDSTHKTMITKSFFNKFELLKVGEFEICEQSFYPFNFSWVGNIFTHNELIVRYER